MSSDEPIGPVLPCGCFTPILDCPYIRNTMGRGPRFKGISCLWMTENGFTRSAESLARAEARDRAIRTRALDNHRPGG